MEGVDPGRRVVIGPVKQWVEAWWNELLDRTILQKAWRHAVVDVAMSARPNAKVQGGAGALMASLRRLAWASPGPDALRARDGTVLYFGEGRAPEGVQQADPRSISKWLEEAYEMEAIRHSTLADDINCVGGERGYGREREQSGGGGRVTAYYGDTEAEARNARVWRGARYEHIEGRIIPWIWPMRRVYIKGLRSGRMEAAASLRAGVEGGWWVPTRLHAAKVMAHDKCRCGLAAGTLWHKLGRCPRTKEPREGMCREEVLAEGQKRVWDPLFSRGVPARPKVPKQPKERQWSERIQEDAEIIAGTGNLVYIDGSAEGWHWRGARAAYSAVCYTADGAPVWRLKGICGEAHPSINRAELRAVLEVLRISAGGVTIKSDSAFVVGGLKKGKKVCTAAGHEGADLWRELWPIWEDLEGTVSVVKVQAHATWVQVMEGRISHMDFVGNREADKAAKEALKVAKLEAPAEAYNYALAMAVAWGKWIMNYASVWDPNVQGEEDAVERALEQEEADEREVQEVMRSSLPHELWKGRGRMVCRRCGRESTAQKTIHTFGTDACKGAAGGRVLAATTGNKNYIWSKHRHSIQEMRGMGLTRASLCIIPEAAIDQGRIDEALIDMEGQAGGTEQEGQGEPSLERQDIVAMQVSSGGATRRKHALRTRGQLMWCDACGAYAHQRAGSRIKGECAGAATTRHRLTRLMRLRAGRHPITGGALMG